MTEIAAVPWNGLKVVSTFSGCGGSCLGFRMAGYRVVWAKRVHPGGGGDVSGEPSEHPLEHGRHPGGAAGSELKRLCGFPDDFVLTGSYSQQWERLGRAVPPVMMFHVAKTICDEIIT
jgi:site-specific DNA-cytosine methylase